MKIVVAIGLVGLWALEWAWHNAETNLRCAEISGICMPNPNIVACIVSEISAFIRTDEQTDLARSTRLVILIKNIFTLWGRKRFLPPVTYFPTSLVYPFTLRVTVIINEWKTIFSSFAVKAIWQTLSNAFAKSCICF